MSEGNIAPRGHEPASYAQGRHLQRALAETMPALVLTTTAEGEVDYCNRMLMDYCGVQLEDLQGARWADLIHPADVASGRNRWTQQVEQLQPFTSEYRIRRHDGMYRWHMTKTAPLRDEGDDSGPIRGWVSVSMDVHDRHQAEDEVRQMSEEVRRAGAAKDQFLTLVSHELRTPVTTIYGNAQVLRRRSHQLPPEQISAAIEDIERESIRLQQLIDNMFVLARLDPQKAVYGEPIPLHLVIERAVDEHRSRYDGADVTIIDETGRTPVCGNTEFIMHILRNLLMNAQTFSGQPSSISVTLEAGDDHTVSVLVRDNGAGFGDDIGKVFDIFYRSPDKAARTRGAGIGLPVARRLVEIQGGRIWAHNLAEGGAEVGFTLPIETED